MVMRHIADGPQPSSSQDRSAGELVRQMSEQISLLVREELRLAQMEMTRKSKQAGAGIGMVSGGGVAALFGAGCLIACAVLAISGALPAWLAALIVGAALLAVAGGAALLGRAHLRRATPPIPTQAAANVKTDVEVIRERARR